MDPLKELDIVWIEPGFALGSCPYAADRDRISQLGIRVVVALHEPDERALAAWAGLGVELLSIPTRDSVAVPAASFDRVTEIVSSCLDAGKPVLLHCLAGINRAPTFAAAVLCRRHGLPASSAMQKVRRARPTASPTPEQEASLREWLRLRGTVRAQQSVDLP